MGEVLDRVKEIKREMTKKECAIADSLLKEPEALITRSITEYALYISSSPATITRFCKRLGLSGFAELKICVANNLSSLNLDMDQKVGKINLEEADTHTDIIKAVLTNAISSINQLGKIISEKELDTVTSYILRARYILLSGIGASSLVALDLHQKLSRLGIFSIYESDVDLQKVNLSSFDSRDLVIAFSYSGMKEEVKNICKLAKRKGVPVISITKQGNNPITLLSDVALHVVPSEALVREGATVSRLQMLTIVDLIFQFLINKQPDVFDTLMETWNNVSGRGDGNDNI